MLTDLQILALLEAYAICYKTYTTLPISHLRHVATKPLKIKSADMEENANNLYFYRLYLRYLSTKFDVTVAQR